MSYPKTILIAAAAVGLTLFVEKVYHAWRMTHFLCGACGKWTDYEDCARSGLDDADICARCESILISSRTEAC